MSVGLKKVEIWKELDDLNREKYEAIYNEGRNTLVAKFGDKTPEYFEQFFLWYRDNIVPQILADLLEANNQKIYEDIKNLISKF